MEASELPTKKRKSRSKRITHSKRFLTKTFPPMEYKIWVTCLRKPYTIQSDEICSVHSFKIQKYSMWFELPPWFGMIRHTYMRDFFEIEHANSNAIFRYTLLRPENAEKQKISTSKISNAISSTYNNFAGNDFFQTMLHLPR